MGLVIFNKQTTAGTSAPFTVDGYREVGLKCTGVSSSEVLNLKVQCGDDWINVLDSAGSAVTFTSTNTPITVSGSGQYVVVKPLTTNPVTIQAD